MKVNKHPMPVSIQPEPGWTDRQSQGNYQNSLSTELLVKRNENPGEDTDFECIDRMVCDDKSAFKQLFDLYYKELYFYARKHVQSGEACKDILQDVFSYLWEKRHQLEINQSVKAYLYRAVHHRCINHLKKENLDYLHLNHFHLWQGFSQGFQHDAHSQLQEKELHKNIERAIDSLPEQCRKIFTLSRQSGLRHKEIASQLSISPKTVEVQIYRALKYLRQQLGISENWGKRLEMNNNGNK